MLSSINIHKAQKKAYIANVTFEPGYRNNCHKHPGSQILLCTGGRGWYREWGKPARELHPSDAVETPVGVKHWHGAAKESGFVHLAVEAAATAGSAEWMEPVSDEEYDKLKCALLDCKPLSFIVSAAIPHGADGMDNIQNGHPLGRPFSACSRKHTLSS